LTVFVGAFRSEKLKKLSVVEKSTSKCIQKTLKKATFEAKKKFLEKLLRNIFININHAVIKCGLFITE